MNDNVNYKNNPLHGLSLKNLLTEIVEHYGYEILFAYLNLNCFKTNASVESSVKFLKKTDWAREKVEAFYLYQYKSLPRASSEQFLLAPRDRIVPDGQVPGEPTDLSLEDAARLQEKRARKSAAHDRGGRRSSKSDAYGKSGAYGKSRERSGEGRNASRNDLSESSTSGKTQGQKFDPWAASKSKLKP